MKTYLVSVSLLSFLLLVGISLAHEQSSGVSGDQIILDGKSIKAGVTPDSFFYGLDVAIDKIRYLLTFDNAAKAKLGLEIARERLMEVREMALENKVEAMQHAQQEHRNSLDNVKKAVAGISKTNSTKEIEDEIKIEKEVEEHENEVEDVSGEVKIKIKVKGNITAEHQSIMDFILGLMQNRTGELKIKINDKKLETILKIKTETNKNETEIEDEVEEIENKTHLTTTKKEKALDKINDAREEIQEVKDKLSQANVTVNVTAVNVLLNQSESHLADAEKAFNETDFGKAFGLANSAEQLAENAKKILEHALGKGEEKREIEVTIMENGARVKVEINNTELKYTLSTTNKEEIVADIAQRTGLTVDEINAIMKIETAGEEEFSCTINSDCTGKILCTQVIGHDTPVCKENKCRCGSINQTEVNRSED